LKKVDKVANILKDLNEAQLKAVESIEGPQMVIAGAGSGKTRVLTYKVAHLLNSGIDPFRVLALTFTNKAAREMKLRITKIIGDTEAKNVWMGTFHSVFARILRSEAERLDYPSNFTIYDTTDSKRLIKTIIKENNLDEKTYTPGYVMNRISGAKSSLVTANQYNADADFTTNDKMSGKPLIGKIFQIYTTRCFKASAMDFDDLLLNAYILLNKFPDVLHKYQKRFQFLLVDEYQDTNHAQYMILKQLAADNENITVVGDDAQSIYAFRGANIKNILNFRNDYPDAEEFKLEQNYRSTKTIVNAANSIIIKNKEQIFKEVWTNNDKGNLIKLVKSKSDNEEGKFIADSIFDKKMNEQRKNSDFAILYRTNAQSRAFEESLRKLNIPYRIYGGLSFYNRKEIKDLISYFRLSINHNDEEAFKRVINYPKRGIGLNTMQKVTIAANNHGVSLWEVADNPKKFNIGLNGGTITKLQAFITLIKSFEAQVQTTNVYELASHIAKTTGILKDLFNDSSPEGVSRYENIEELLNAIKDFSEQEREILPEEIHENPLPEFRTLDEFMQDVALLTNDDKDDDTSDDKVKLMTIHSAKGLEFPYVYIVGLEENLFPSIQSLNSRADLEEERRLFYVAMTRAEHQLFLSYAETRYRWGDLSFTEPSRFIEEVGEEFIEPLNPVKKITPKPTDEKPRKTYIKRKLKKITSDSPQDDFSADDSSMIQTGMQVRHSKFGFGKVTHIEGEGPSRKATVFFHAIGNKQLLLKYAKLKIVDN